MLPRVHRLTKSSDFSLVFREKRWSAHHRYISVFAHPSGASCSTPSQSDESFESVHVGFIVSKSVGNAVVRNRVKRRLRSWVRQSRPLLPPVHLLVIRANPAAAQASYLQLSTALEATMRKLVTTSSLRTRHGTP